MQLFFGGFKLELQKDKALTYEFYCLEFHRAVNAKESRLYESVTAFESHMFIATSEMQSVLIYWVIVWVMGVTVPVSTPVQGDVKSQNDQDSLEEAAMQPNMSTLKISNQEDLTDPPPKGARFEMVTFYNNSWELPSRLSEYL